MKMIVEVEGVAMPLELSREDALWRFRLDGAGERRADVCEPEASVYTVLLEGRSYEARVEEAPDGLVVVISGRRFEIAVRDPRRWSRKAETLGSEGRQNVMAPMPGKVVRILVSAGDEVAAGQGLLVVEAMKMQNEMKAARAGTVVSVMARDGVTVAAGEVLVTIE